MREFKYLPEDFGELPVKVLHMNLDFDVYDDHTVVKSQLKTKALKGLKSLELNARDLEIKHVSCKESEVKHVYSKEKAILTINFEQPIEKDTEFTISTETVCKPTKNVLEGIYFDETPKGAPPTQITQCQQWGFQRIVPCIDDMTAKCTYITRITADSRYTSIITNGDVSEERKSIGNGRDSITYNNTITPMAPYLFFLGVGTYKTVQKEFEYPNGDSFMLELLVPPDSDEDLANKALQILYDSVMWVYLFTGPNTYKNYKKSLEIKKLVEERDALKESKGDVSEIRGKLKEAIAGLTLGYKYTGTVYREIGMQNSNFGGMENVGNTTITTNRIMPFPDMTDSSFEYMIRVKVHEYYHNLNGSEVTGWSPFEIWLNEAVTVVIEKQYHAFLFGKDYSRMDTVLTLLAPEGTLRGDESPATMPIEPDGFNHPDELITGVTYVKAPEFVRMIELLAGKENFVKGLDAYHKKFAHSNATRAQWIKAMEEACGKDFKHMTQDWLKQTGYPTIEVTKESDKLTFKQKGKKQWELPIQVGDEVVWMQKPEITIPASSSLNQEYSFFGKLKYSQSEEELYQQASTDADVVNRFMAFHHLADKVKLSLIENPNQEPDEKFIGLFFNMLSDDRLMENISTQILAIFESVEDERYAHSYQELYDARKKILHAVTEKYKDEILKLYGKYSNPTCPKNYTEQQVCRIKNRQVKNLCLRLLATLDTEDIHTMIKKQLDSDSATDRVSAFALYLNSSAADKLSILEGYQKKAEKNLVAWETFLRVVGGNSGDDALEIIRKVEKSPHFRIEQSNDQRALFGGFAMNRKKSMLTEEGRAYLKEKIIQLAPVNEYNTLPLIKIFGALKKIPERYQEPLRKVLEDCLNELDVKNTPSVVNTIKRILKA